MHEETLKDQLDEAFAHAPEPGWDDGDVRERALAALRRRTRRRWSAATSVASLAAVGAVLLTGQGGAEPDGPAQPPVADGRAESTSPSLDLVSAVAAVGDDGTVSAALLTEATSFLEEHMPTVADCRVDRAETEPMGPESAAMEVTCAKFTLRLLIVDRFAGAGPASDYRGVVGVPDGTSWDAFLTEAIKSTGRVFAETGLGDIG